MSRRGRTAIFIFCVLLAAVLIVLDRSPIRPSWLAREKNTQQADALDFGKYHAKTFTVVNVVDGDTIDIDVPDGAHRHTRIRLWGIDTPETKSPRVGVMYFGPQAANFVKKLTLGQEIRVYLDMGNRTRDKYARLLAYVQLPDSRFLNEVLLSEGLGYADLRFKHSFYHKYLQLEAAARSGKKGLWENIKREQLPEWLQRREPNLLKAKE